MKATKNNKEMISKKVKQKNNRKIYKLQQKIQTFKIHFKTQTFLNIHLRKKKCNHKHNLINNKERMRTNNQILLKNYLKKIIRSYKIKKKTKILLNFLQKK